MPLLLHWLRSNASSAYVTKKIQFTQGKGQARLRGRQWGPNQLGLAPGPIPPLPSGLV